MPAARIFLQLIADFVVYLGLLIRPRKAIAAENLFLRRQLALYQERRVDLRRIDPATRNMRRYFSTQDRSALALAPLLLIHSDLAALNAEIFGLCPEDAWSKPEKSRHRHR